MSYRFMSDFRNIQLSPKGLTNYENKKVLWEEAMDLLEEYALEGFAMLELDPKSLEETGIGGTYQTWRGNCPTLELRLFMNFDEPTNTIEFTEVGYALFVHEYSHLLHIYRDNGEYMAPIPNVKGTYTNFDKIVSSNTQRRNTEFEAGYRSLMLGRAYELYPDGDRTILEANLVNISNYDREWRNDPIMKEIIEKKLGVLEMQAEMKKHIFDNVEYFTDWAEPTHGFTIT